MTFLSFVCWLIATQPFLVLFLTMAVFVLVCAVAWAYVSLKKT